MFHKAKATSLAPAPAKKTGRQVLIVSLLILFLVGVFVYLEIDLLMAIGSFPQFVLFFFNNFLPPDFGNTLDYLPLIEDTVLFAVVGTYLSAFLAFIFGLLISEKINPYKPLRLVVKFIISFLRNVPVLIWAALLIYIFGIGNMVGLIALVFATLGFLSRSYAESIDEIAGTKLESLKACGASRMQILFHGLIPEFIPAWINWTLFSFEINIRASAILGMVGAGGIGIMIQTNIRLFKYNEALSLVIILVCMVLVTEFITNKVRARV
ncbi:MAG: phosphonate ABC transporter, permease protein PhnE [Lachnospiraceae bacterium]|jgi:phosphonate transport system permease protein|nr:phosphonate ABC transporter, permease protein PhnE [Lachnospiraceae bacterium]